MWCIEANQKYQFHCSFLTLRIEIIPWRSVWWAMPRSRCGLCAHWGYLLPCGLQSSWRDSRAMAVCHVDVLAQTRPCGGDEVKRASRAASVMEKEGDVIKSSSPCIISSVPSRAEHRIVCQSFLEENRCAWLELRSGGSQQQEIGKQKEHAQREKGLYITAGWENGEEGCELPAAERRTRSLQGPGRWPSALKAPFSSSSSSSFSSLLPPQAPIQTKHTRPQLHSCLDTVIHKHKQPHMLCNLSETESKELGMLVLCERRRTKKSTSRQRAETGKLCLWVVTRDWGKWRGRGPRGGERRRRAAHAERHVVIGGRWGWREWHS